MIETETIWEDTGFDCDHCGGVMLKRIDRETGQPERTCFQCRECGCQWDLGGKLLRSGQGQYCRPVRPASPGGLDMGDMARWAGMLSRSLWLLLALIAGFFLLRFGGGLVLRYVLPAILILAAAYAVLRYGQRQKWW